MLRNVIKCLKTKSAEGVRKVEDNKKEILYKQLELLAEDSKKENANLIENTHCILEIMNVLLTFGW